MPEAVQGIEDEPVRVIDLACKDDYVQTQYIKKAAVIGSARIGVFDVQNNPEGEYPDPPLSEYSLQLITQASTSGTFDLGIRRFRADASTGAMLLAPPETPCFYSMESEFSLLNVGLPPVLFQDAMHALGSADMPDFERLHADVMFDPRIGALVRAIHDAATTGLSNEALLVDQLVYRIAALLVEKAGNMTRRPGAPKPLSDKELGQAITAMQDHMEDGITLTALARLCGERNVYQFNRAFRLRVGVTPYKYLIWLRVRRAQELLQGTQMSLSEIAYACGFSSQAHFTTVFGRIIGATPGAYRADNQR